MQNSYTNKSLHISPQYICFDISKHSSLAYSQGYTDCLAYAFMVFTFSVLLWPCSLVLLFILQSFILICILIVHVSRFVLIVLYFCVVSQLFYILYDCLFLLFNSHSCSSPILVLRSYPYPFFSLYSSPSFITLVICSLVLLFNLCSLLLFPFSFLLPSSPSFCFFNHFLFRSSSPAFILYRLSLFFTPYPYLFFSSFSVFSIPITSLCTCHYSLYSRSQ